MPRDLKVVPKDEPTEQATGFDEGYATLTFVYRGVSYTMRELEIGEYDKIEKAATERVEQDDGTSVERVNGTLQNRMMIAKALQHPQSDEAGYLPVPKMGTRLYLNVQRKMQELHFGEEPDALKKATKKNDSALEAEDDKGNG